MIAALKQCRRSWLPELAAPQSLDALLDATTADVRLLCHGAEGTPPLRAALDRTEWGEDVLVLVGPEGGFAPSEVEAAAESGCWPVSLGPRRLRAETAGIAAAHAVLLHGQRQASGEGHRASPDV